jgi:hypothetical protein
MNTTDKPGWLVYRASTEEHKIENKLDEIVVDNDELFREVRRSWHPMEKCLLRDGRFVIYSEVHLGSKVTRIDLTFHPSSPDRRNWGHYTILEGGKQRHGTIVRLRTEQHPPFTHYFRLDSISNVKNQPEDLSWKVAILKAVEVHADNGMGSDSVIPPA